MIPYRDSRFTTPLAIALAGLAVLALLGWLAPGLIDELEAKTIDYRFRLRHALGASPRVSDTVAIVEMDDDCVDRFGRPPWPRKIHAAVVANLARAGARAVVFDLFFRQATRPEDDGPFLEACRRSGRVAVGLPVAIVPDSSLPPRLPSTGPLDRFLGKIPVEGSIVPPVLDFKEPLEALVPCVRSMGHIVGEPDPDGTFRRFPPLVSIGGRPLPSLGVVMACLALGVDPAAVEARPGMVVVPATRGEIRIPVDGKGRMWLDFPGRFATTFVDFTSRRMHPTCTDVCDLTASQPLFKELRDRVCLVAMTSTGSDVGIFPLETNVPRCMVHATVASSILTGRFLRQAPRWVTWILLLGLVVVLLAIVRRVGPISFAAVAVGLMAGYAACVCALFIMKGWIVDLFEPLLLVAWTAVGTVQHRLTFESRRRRELVHAFSRYFSPRVMARILENPDTLLPTTQRKVLTILFSDIRGFTTLSETLDPDDVQKLLREYFDRMTEIVFSHGGTVDKFIGDGLLVFFGDPEPCEDHASRAVRTAIEMQLSVRDLSRRRVAAGLLPLEIRIGINTGRVAVGNLGATRRMEYSVIGHAVNLAQRLESAAPPGGILIGEATRSALGDSIGIRASRSIQVKGIEHPVEAHEVALGEPAGAGSPGGSGADERSEGPPTRGCPARPQGEPPARDPEP